MTKFKTQILIKLKNSNNDKTQKLKLWENSKTQIVTKKNIYILWQNSKTKNGKKSNYEKKNFSWEKTQIVAKLKLGQKSSCVKTQIVTKIKLRRKTKKKTQCDKTQMVTKLESSNYDKTQKLKLWQNLKYDKSKVQFDTLTTI